MPSATLRFTLPAEREEYETCVHAGEYRVAVADALEHIRSRLKYADPPLSTAAQAELEGLRLVILESLDGLEP